MSRIVWGNHGALAGSLDEGPAALGVEVVVAAADPIDLIESGVAGVLELGARAVVDRGR